MDNAKQSILTIKVKKASESHKQRNGKARMKANGKGQKTIL